MIVGATMLPALSASASTVVKVSGTVTSTISSSMPFARLTFSRSVKISNLPELTTTPALTSSWQQVGPREFQAVVTGQVQPTTTYVVDVPASLRCSSSCTFLAVRRHSASTNSNDAWEQQLLAELNYLPASFTSLSVPSNATSPSNGFYTWAYPRLPKSLSGLWSVGNNNIIVRGALMNFQNNHQLPTTGVADNATWNDLLKAVASGQKNPSTYNYVTVSEASPETVQLYVGGKATFHTLANTGISVAPTPLGTFPVYLRYESQTMAGTNPDGSHYSDPGIPWISYFDGGSALHGFIRASYGWPQSLGCVEMPFTSAQTIWPHTPIGTLVTVETA
jgi:peptidoglycan hydrolase-like protein with peptidoglycan-binding domain